MTRKTKPKVIFIPLSATGYSTLYNAYNNSAAALWNAGVPEGAARRYREIWVYQGDHMICLKDADGCDGLIEPISEVPGYEFWGQVAA